MVKTSAKFRMLTGFTKEEMADLGGVLTWLRKEQRDAFASWVRNFDGSNQNHKSQQGDRVAGVRFCIVSGKHKAQFQAEVQLETCESDATSKIFKLMVHGFRARQKTKRKTTGTREATAHEGERRVRRPDFEVRDSGLEVVCDIGEGENDDDPLFVTRSISPGLQLLLGTADTGQDVCTLFAKTETDKLEIWLNDELVGRPEDGHTSSTNSLWCLVAMPAVESLGVYLEVNCRLTFQHGDRGGCLVIQKMRWSTATRSAKAKVRRRPQVSGTPARVDSARLRAADSLASL